jgi:hypothetical protein
MVNALWIQCGILLVMIAIPLIGIKGIDDFFKRLIDMSALSLAVPYIILGVAYFVYRMKGNIPPFVMLKSKAMVIIASAVVLILGFTALIGAGYGEIAAAKNFKEAFDPFLNYYGGPIILLLVGLIITYITKLVTNKNADKSKSI